MAEEEDNSTQNNKNLLEVVRRKDVQLVKDFLENKTNLGIDCKFKNRVFFLLSSFLFFLSLLFFEKNSFCKSVDTVLFTSLLTKVLKL